MATSSGPTLPLKVRPRRPCLGVVLLVAPLQLAAVTEAAMMTTAPLPLVEADEGATEVVTEEATEVATAVNAVATTTDMALPFLVMTETEATLPHLAEGATMNLAAGTSAIEALLHAESASEHVAQPPPWCLCKIVWRSVSKPHVHRPGVKFISFSMQ